MYSPVNQDSKMAPSTSIGQTLLDSIKQRRVLKRCSNPFFVVELFVNCGDHQRNGMFITERRTTHRRFHSDVIQVSRKCQPCNAREGCEEVGPVYKDLLDLI